MKKVFFILLVIISFQGFSQSVKLPEIGLEVMTEDLGKMGWDDAKKNCDSLGDGWRLPTIDELQKMKKFKDKIGNLKKEYYWSSTPNGPKEMLALHFDFGNTYGFIKYFAQHVRAVRTLK